MPADAIAQQLALIVDRQATMATDVAVIKAGMSAVTDHEQRIRVLEAARARVAAVWAAAAAVGAILGGLGGWLAAFFTVRH